MNNITNFISSKEPFKIKEITISSSRTINLGNYESMQVQGSCTIEIDDSSQLELARDKAIQEVRKQMNEVYIATKPKK